MKYFVFWSMALLSSYLSSCGSITHVSHQSTDSHSPDTLDVASSTLYKEAIVDTTVEKLLPTSESAVEPDHELTTVSPSIDLEAQPTKINYGGLIEALASQFSWQTHTHQHAVSQRLERYKSKPKQLETLLARSSNFLPFIADQINARGLPAELAFLPVVESGNIPSAHSPSGAAGLWQIMPATAEYLELRMNWWFDERLDMQVSTEKALNYLEYLNDQFDGNWELAISAYNGGEGHLRSRIRQAGNDDFWALTLKEETEAYLPQLLAIVEVLKNPESYGVEIPEIAMDSPLQEVEFNQQIDLRMLADSAGMKMDEFSALNPSFLRWVSPPKGDYKVLVPKTRLNHVNSGLSSFSTEELANWDHYKVRSGDTLIDIARKHGVTLRALMAVNELSNSRIYERQELLIPISETPSSAPERPNSIRELYIVQNGDSLWEIAHENNATVSELRSLNNLGSRALIQPGQVLILSEIFTGSEQLYTVKAGDSLSEIAVRFDVALSDLRSWNEINTKDLIRPGQQLKIRTDG